MNDADGVDLAVVVVDEPNTGLNQLFDELVVVPLLEPAGDEVGLDHHDMAKNTVRIGLDIDPHLYRVMMLEYGGSLQRIAK